MDWVGTRAVTVIVKDSANLVHEQSIHRDDEGQYRIAQIGSNWGFDGDGRLFRLVVEAQRIRLASLFDPLLAVHSSAIQPLPHQIEAVYGQMLPRVPMRYALCDDPGAGKTIMAGLYIKEMLLRGDLRRCLIVAPGGLVNQWQDELREKFDIRFEIMTRAGVDASYDANPFDTPNQHLICRLDVLARDEVLLDRAARIDWDLVVVDEAHRMAAHQFGNEVKRTKRYRVGERLGRARNFLMLTATPHAGKEEDFQLWMALLDGDRFEGRAREGAHTADVSDLMRRMVKERLLTFEGTSLFPARRAYTLEYSLSLQEKALYEAVTTYVIEEMNRAERITEDGERRRAAVGFALTSIQRRVASSPEAILKSLERRVARLRKRELELATGGKKRTMDQALERAERIIAGIAADDDPEAIDDLTPEDEENLEVVVDGASAAQTLEELRGEIRTLVTLEALARKVRNGGEDKKWKELKSLLENNEHIRLPDGSFRKLIVFTESRDTLNYLVERLSALLADLPSPHEAVVAIHGGTVREERRAIQERFMNSPDVVVLVATDAAGEGINLQRAHLMVNYDLPWNPNRIEQRFGRIHRIGQDNVCHLWNLVAHETREGQVYRTLLAKLDEQRQALGDQVFDVLGQAFRERSLRDLLIDAIKYGDDPARRVERERVINASVGESLKDLIELNALDATVMDRAMVAQARIAMQEAEARRLQPHYIRAFWESAFEELGGKAAEREPGRFEVTRVPKNLRDLDRVTGTTYPLLGNYERVCFEPRARKVAGKPPAALVTPGHPLLDTVVDRLLAVHGQVARTGAVLIDESDLNTSLRVLVGLEHRVVNGVLNGEGQRTTVSRRFEFVTVTADGSALPAGPAPHLDYRPATSQERESLENLVAELGSREDIERRAMVLVLDGLAQEHLAQVRSRIGTRIEKMKREVNLRLTAEARYWDGRAQKLRLEVDAGRQPVTNFNVAEQRADELVRRRDRRLGELEAEGQLSSQPPSPSVIALVVPLGIFERAGVTPEDSARNAAQREMVERRAVDLVLATEARLGGRAEEQPRNNPGFDIKSTRDGQLLLIEVKGRIEGAATVTVTRNEILTGLNTEKFVLALVEVSPAGSDADQVRYVRNPFSGADDTYFDMTSVNYDWVRLWAKGGEPT